MSWLLTSLVRVYQLTLGRVLPDSCIYIPCCSEYMIEAIRVKGPVIGVLKGIWRICRCHPFARGGYDPVEPPPPDNPGAAGQ